MRKTTVNIIILVALSLLPAWAQNYELGWDVLQKSAKSADSYTLDWNTVDKHVDRAEPGIAVVAAPPVITNVAPPAPAAPQVAQSPKTRTLVRRVPVYDVTVTASQFYDQYAQHYKKVDSIEVALTHGGRTMYDVIENRGCYGTVDVPFRNLEPGDSYKVRIIWKDGSNRTVEKTIGTFVDRKIYIDEPDYLAYSDSWK